LRDESKMCADANVQNRYSVEFTNVVLPLWVFAVLYTKDINEVILYIFRVTVIVETFDFLF
jgi:hypothetical protein